MRLVVEQGELAGQEFALEQATVMIGRGQENDVILAGPRISRQHARLQHEPQGWTVTDLGSTNGTSVNGQLLRPRQPYLLYPGDRLAIGSSVIAIKEPGVPPGIRSFQKQRERHPALLVAGALLLVIALTSIVVVLVIMLQPQQESVTPAPMNQIQQLITALPVPTEFQDIVTSVVPLIPTGLPILPLGDTATPPPSGAVVPPVKAQNGGTSP